MHLASCSLDVIGNAPFYSCFPSRHIVLPECVRHCPFLRFFLANSNTTFIANSLNVLLRLSGHILGLLRRMQNLSQLVEAIATGDRWSIDTIEMTYRTYFLITLLLLLLLLLILLLLLLLLLLFHNFMI